MTDFQDDAFDRGALKNGSVLLCWKISIFDEIVRQLPQLGYSVIQVEYSDEVSLQKEISTSLKWQEQFGYSPWNGNLDALNDALREPSVFSDAGRLAICISRFDRLVTGSRGYAANLLDVIANQSREHLVDGRRLLAVIQTEDNAYETPELGGSPAQWNSQEWLWANRGLK